jgi:hypothetical protein
MNLAPLLSASPAIQVHAFAAMSAFALGLVQLSAPKGTLPHRMLGGIWVAIMFIVAISSFSRAQALGAVEPDSSIVDLHPRDVAAWRLARSYASSAGTSLDDDLAFRRRAFDRRPVHLRTRPHHARGPFWLVSAPIPPNAQRPQMPRFRPSEISPNGL